MTPAPNFDRVARLYRWAEYASLGTALERCRNHHLARVAGRSRALILGDGDGRFTARLLLANPRLRVEVVDLSEAMLRLLRARCGPTPRLRTARCNALQYEPSGKADLVVAHFLFDCFPQVELDLLVSHIAARAEPDALWMVSDFRIPSGKLRWPGWIYIRLLYFAFRLLTGLRVTRLPDFAASLRRCGLRPLAVHRSLFGLLTTELWQSEAKDVSEVGTGEEATFAT